MSKIIDFVETALLEELAPIPVVSDKNSKINKHPRLEKGSIYFKQRIPEHLINNLFDGTNTGVALKGGEISDGLECLDFDDHEGKHNLYEIIKKFVNNDFIKNLIDENKVYVQLTQSKGYHFIYKYHSNRYEGSKKLAMWDDGEVMIETRGEGGYFLVAPTQGYEVRSGDLLKLEKIEKEERDLIIDIARSFNRLEKQDPEKSVDSEGLKTEPTDPISLFNINKVAYAKKLLEEQGWKKQRSDEHVEYWSRPGKSSGTSATWGYKYNSLYVWSSNSEPFQPNCYYTPFQILIKLRFNGSFADALTYVSSKSKVEIPTFPVNDNIPYIRVGADYYKIFYKRNTFGTLVKEIKPYKKEEIKEDFGKEFIKEIPKYDDFTIEPSNTDYKPVIENCYNLYSEFRYEPIRGDITWSMRIMEHVFGDQIEQGMKYMQALYMYPKRILPILALVSEDRSTGKTTFLEWISAIFGSNVAPVGNNEIISDFNGTYAMKNIITIEEVNLDRADAAEKLKTLSTSKEITINQKFVNGYKVPCFYKIIMASNNENNFMKIDYSEIRYWVRKLGEPKHRKTNIMTSLRDEIPAFLYELTQLDPIPEETKSRQIFDVAELNTEALSRVKNNSRSTLYKDLFEYFTDLFNDNNDFDYVYVRPIEIKDNWLARTKFEPSYIKRVLQDEFKFKQTDKNRRHEAFTPNPGSLNGRPFVIPRNYFIDSEGLNVPIQKASANYVHDENLPF